MPTDWYSPLLEAVRAFAWPITLAILVLVFKRPIGRLIDELQEIAAFGASAKRGDRRAEQLVGEEGGSPSPASEEGAESSNSLATSESTTITPAAPRPATESDRAARTAAQEPLPFLNFARGLIRLKIGTRLDKSDATSKQLAAEMVRGSYSDLLLAVRIAAYWVAGPESVSGSRGRKAVSHVTLQRAGAPDDLVDQVRDLHDLSRDVAEEREVLSATGAGKYVRSAQSAADQVLLWAVDQLKQAESSDPITDRLD